MNMCRMFAYVGSSHNDLERLYDALKESASHDQNMTFIDEKGRKHSDGWGCVVLTGNKLYHYRTITPIYEDDFVVPNAEGKIYAVFHARRASAGSATGSSIFSHPLTAMTDKQIIFLAHNGSLKGPVPPNSVDSELVLKKLAEKGSLTASMGELDGMMDTALNLFVLSIDRAARRARLECLNYWRRDPARDLYYSLYTSEMHGGRAVYSSTLEGKRGLKGHPCERGKVTELI